MDLLTKLLKLNLSLINKLADKCSVENSRITMDKLGKIISYRYKSHITYRKINSPDFQAEYIIPRKSRFDGIILYLHGGGYVLGGMDYAKGFGTLLAANINIAVCCLAYRLAPENKFPAALIDAYNAYCYLLKSGYSSKNIILCGESAGGGLVYALALELKLKNCLMPSGIIAISPWSNLTLSGESYNKNYKKDPSMTKKRLQSYVQMYTEQVRLPYVSPVFGDFSGFPPSLIFAGADEILLSDSVNLHQKLISCGCRSILNIAPEMWHVYLMYRVKEAEQDYKKINDFLEDVLYEDQ
ncbi:MAG: alpha/beta hydrolase [Clostridia bacterium]|nr:alpha/beta hydrolase [Clostridia bacterium]